MRSFIDDLMVQTLRAQIEVSRLYLLKLAEQLTAASGRKERRRLALLFAETLKQAEAMENDLALLEQQEREREDKKTEDSSRQS